MPTVTAPPRRASVSPTPAPRNQTSELTRQRRRHAEPATMISASASRLNAISAIEMRGIPYTLASARLWREFPVRYTVFAHEALDISERCRRDRDHRALPLYVRRGGYPGVHRLHGVSGTLELRDGGRSYRGGSDGDSPQHRMRAARERHERDDCVRQPRSPVRAV